MAFSRLTYTYSGTNVFAVNFALGYLDESHVTGRVNEEIDGLGDPVYRTLTFITSGTVSLSGTLNNGDTVVLERTTPKETLQHDFEDGAVLEESNLDESHKQALMVAHEALDGRFDTFSDDLNMGGNQIKNMADGTLAQDATTLSQVADLIGVASGLSGSFPASGISYDPATSGLTATDVQAALDEIDSDLDTAEVAVAASTLITDVVKTSASRVALFKLL